jgi:hypothetical protein
MSAMPTELWPWLALVGLGAFHGINPAMGWLFAVALGLNRQNRGIVLLSLVPIALGHVTATGIVLVAVLTLGLVLDPLILARAAAVLLAGWALWLALRGHRQRVRIGMQTGLIGLGVWSFLTASAHGAGLMLIPVVMPICLAGATGPMLSASASIPVALAAIAVHGAAILATIAIVSIVVYDRIGVGFLRRGWINLDRLWIAALLVTSVIAFEPWRMTL